MNPIRTNFERCTQRPTKKDIPRGILRPQGSNGLGGTTRWQAFVWNRKIRNRGRFAVRQAGAREKRERYREKKNRRHISIRSERPGRGVCRSICSCYFPEVVWSKKRPSNFAQRSAEFSSVYGENVCGPFPQGTVFGWLVKARPRMENKSGVYFFFTFRKQSSRQKHFQT